jgi:3-hydroxyacyl-CoA dehydrogenase
MGAGTSRDARHAPGFRFATPAQYRLADFIGLDPCLSVIQVLYEGLSDFEYRPCPLLVKYVEAGWLGEDEPGLLRLHGNANAVARGPGNRRSPRQIGGPPKRCDTAALRKRAVVCAMLPQ